MPKVTMSPMTLRHMVEPSKNTHVLTVGEQRCARPR
jgi:hypothetical protein